MGRFLASCGSAPELIISSTAVRAMETARLAVDGGGLGVPIVKNADLYGCSSATVLSAVRSADSGASCIMLVGHEPTWSSTVSRLIGGGNVRMPTAAAARIDFEIDRWSDADFGRGELAWLVVPRAIS
jgi:phosphohistidine phosphatase